MRSPARGRVSRAKMAGKAKKRAKQKRAPREEAVAAAAPATVATLTDWETQAVYCCVLELAVHCYFQSDKLREINKKDARLAASLKKVREEADKPVKRSQEETEAYAMELRAFIALANAQAFVKEALQLSHIQAHAEEMMGVPRGSLDAKRAEIVQVFKYTASAENMTRNAIGGARNHAAADTRNTGDEAEACFRAAEEAEAVRIEAERRRSAEALARYKEKRATAEAAADKAAAELLAELEADDQGKKARKHKPAPAPFGATQGDGPLHAFSMAACSFSNPSSSSGSNRLGFRTPLLPSWSTDASDHTRMDISFSENATAGARGSG